MCKKPILYNVIVLLITIAAFPISVVAVDKDTLTDPSICHFDLNGESSNSNFIQCDHCTYYHDFSDQVLFLTDYFISYSRSLSTIFETNDYFINYHFSFSPRSPPIS